MGTDEAEDYVVRGGTHGFTRKDKVVQTGINGADNPSGRGGKLLTLFLNLKRIKHTVTGLEIRIPVAAVDLATAVHNENRDGDMASLMRKLRLRMID